MVEAGAALTTVFDVLSRPPVLPATIASGNDPILQLTDGFRRDPDLTGTCTGVAALLGFPATPGQPVRVEMDVAWPDAGVTPGLVELRSGSASATFLVPGLYAAPDPRPATIWLDVPGEEIPVGGLLLVEILPAGTQLPEHIRRRCRQSGVRGMVVHQVRLTVPPPGSDRDQARSVPVADGFVLVQGLDTASVTLEGRLLRPGRGPKRAAETGAAAGAPAVLRRPPPRGFYADRALARRLARRQSGRGAVLGRGILRFAAATLPTVAQRWLVMVNLSITGRSSIRRVVAVDLVSGSPVDVTTRTIGSRLALDLSGAPAGEVLIDLRGAGRSGLYGPGARWIDWINVA